MDLADRASLINLLRKGTTMNKLNITAIAATVALAFSAGAIAQSMSKDDYKAEKDKIAAEYKSGKAGCSSLAGNAKDICVAEAKGKESVAIAELEAGYKPTPKAHYAVRVAKADRTTRLPRKSAATRVAMRRMFA